MARPQSDIRLRIVHAARDVFAGESVDGASLRAIARAARTSIGMIYYYFPSKEELFFAVVEEVYAGFLADLTEALTPAAPTGQVPGHSPAGPAPTVAERLGRLYRRIGAMTDLELQVVRLCVREALTSTERRARLIERAMNGHLPLLLRLILEGMQDGSLDAGRHPALLLVCTGAIGAMPQLVARQLPVLGIPQGEALAGALVEILLHGIAPRQP
jgi:AcrR family transcriptional regulator